MSGPWRCDLAGCNKDAVTESECGLRDGQGFRAILALCLSHALAYRAMGWELSDSDEVDAADAADASALLEDA